MHPYTAVERARETVKRRDHMCQQTPDMDERAARVRALNEQRKKLHQDERVLKAQLNLSERYQEQCVRAQRRTEAAQLRMRRIHFDLIGLEPDPHVHTTGDPK